MGLCDMPVASCVRDTCLACVLVVCVTLAFGWGTVNGGRPLNYSLCNCKTISPELVGNGPTHQAQGMWVKEGEGTIPRSNAKPLPFHSSPNAEEGLGCSDRAISSLQVHRGAGGPSDL